MMRVIPSGAPKARSRGIARRPDNQALYADGLGFLDSLRSLGMLR